MECLCHKLQQIRSVCRNHNPILFLIHDALITGFVTRVTQRGPLVGPELPTFPEHRFIEGP
jgi:hypothetical protein